MKYERGILIVEDEILLAMNTKLTLEDCGYRVTGIATSSAEAKEFFELDRPDLVLMDITLDDGEDGVELARMLCTQCKVPIIYMSGNSDDMTLSRASSTGAVNFLRKPIDEDELIASVREILPD